MSCSRLRDRGLLNEGDLSAESSAARGLRPAKDVNLIRTNLGPRRAPLAQGQESRFRMTRQQLARTLRVGHVPACLLASFGLVLVGCDSSDPLSDATSTREGKQVLTSANVSPRSVLENCVRTYQQLTSYEDRAFVQLSYRLDGEPLVDRAPLAVAWDKQGRLGMRVYSVSAGPTDQRWRLRLTARAGEALENAHSDAKSEVPQRQSEQLANSLERQVISRAVPAQVSFEWLLSDPLVAEQLAAGLAGFPPQLDLLLSPEPLSGLADASAPLSFSAAELIEQQLCHVVNVNRNGAEYRLWIEQATGLLRRVQIPNQNLASAIQHDRRVSELQLTIELQQVQINRRVAWKRFEVQVQPGEQLVTHFIPPPPVIETAGLGVKIPAFFLNDPAGELAYSSVARSKRKATVLVWLADHPACRLAAEQLSVVEKKLTAAGVKESVEFVAVWAEPTAPSGLSFTTLVDSWKLPGKLTVDRDALGRDLFKVDEAPTLIVLDANNRVQLRESGANPILEQVLPQLLLQVAQGEDLAQQLIERNRGAATRHAAELALAAAVDASAADMPESYGPGVVRLTELARTTQRRGNVAATVDASQSLWLLADTGQLESFAPLFETATESLQTPWKSESGALVLTASPNADYFALLSQSGSRLQVLDRRSLQNTELQLNPEGSVVDMQWLTVGGSKWPRLAVIDNRSQTILFDPSNHEQLSGRCPSPAVAILGHDSLPNSIGGLVVLANRSLEPLQLDDESTLRRSLGQSASHASTAALPKTLSFTPAAGPWNAWEDVSSRWVLARGWLASDEPALFMLDNTLAPQWHYRLPSAKTKPPAVLSSVAKDPGTGQAVWAISELDRTVHLVRSDGGSDHFRVRKPLVGLALTPSGARLVLTLIHADETVRYDVRW